jgi:hypothetical protein
MSDDEKLARLQHLHTIVCTCPIGQWGEEIEAAVEEYFELREQTIEGL